MRVLNGHMREMRIQEPASEYVWGLRMRLNPHKQGYLTSKKIRVVRIFADAFFLRRSAAHVGFLHDLCTGNVKNVSRVITHP